MKELQTSALLWKGKATNHRVSLVVDRIDGKEGRQVRDS